METTKLPGFQQYLVDKGFKRTCLEHCGKKEIEDYESIFLSSYNPIDYVFRKDNKECSWGLSEHGKPPVMYLGVDKMRVINSINLKTFEDGYRILFSKWGEDKYDLIYDVFISDNKYFTVDCKDDNNIIITINEQERN